MSEPEQFPGIEIRIDRSDALDAAEAEQVHALFAETYASPNHAYLDKSLDRLGSIACARAGETLVAFALSDARRSPLPGFDAPQTVLLAGMGCVRDAYRRTGLFSQITVQAARANGVLARASGRILACGRMAHPVGFRSMRHLPSVIPNREGTLSAWHLDVAAAVAELYGVRLRANSVVVAGSGKPIGYPRLEMEVDAEEWVPFAQVDRDRGDSLLGLAWVPDAPPGW